MKRNVNKVVTLVKYPSNLPLSVMPHIGDYDNPYIKEIRPCEERGGQYYDLRTGEKVQQTSEHVWLNLTGTVFQYPDGELLLITCRFRDKHLVCMEINPNQFNPETMFVRTVVKRHEKKEA